MARTLYFRLVEVKMFRWGEGYRIEGYLLIRGQGVVIRFDIGRPGDLPGTLAGAIAAAYNRTTGEKLPDPT